MDFVVAPDDPSNIDVRELLERHLRYSRQASPAEHVHALDEAGWADPSVSFLSARRDGVLLGVGALKELSAFHGELKAMHTEPTARRCGVGRALLGQLLSLAAHRSYEQVSLETGTMEAFAAARSLYAKAGFVACAPFSHYSSNPYSICMTIHLDAHTVRNLPLG